MDISQTNPDPAGATVSIRKPHGWRERCASAFRCLASMACLVTLLCWLSTTGPVPAAEDGDEDPSGDVAAPSASASPPAPLPPIPATFVHPGVYYSSSDLDFMRRKIEAKAEPWISAWEEFKPEGKQVNLTPQPVERWETDMYFGFDPLNAHRLALAWALTGDSACGGKAVEILDAWSSTLKEIVKRDGNVPQQKLAMGVSAHHFVNAAELLRHGGPGKTAFPWPEERQKQFAKMLDLFHDAMDGFYPQFNGNWDALMMNSMIAIAVYLDDRAMFEKVVRHYLIGVPPHGGLPNYIYPSGQCQETKRDQLHVQWGIGGLVGVCEIAHNQGVDLYGALDNRLLKGLEYTAKYNLGEEVEFEGKKIGTKGRGRFLAIWETPYQHYVHRKGLEMPYVKRILESDSVATNWHKKDTTGPYRPEGESTFALGWGTLAKFRGSGGP